MNTLPEDYVVLGHIKDINTPKSWGTAKFFKPTDSERFIDWAYQSVFEKWIIVDNIPGWLAKSSNCIIAARIGSALYNMNLPKKSARPTVKQVEELNSKILDLETSKFFLEAENKKLREQLAAISKILNG